LVIGGVAIAIVGFFIWHALDKRSAVKRAIVEYIAETELKTLRAEKAEYQRRAGIFQRINSQLELEMASAETEHQAQLTEITEYAERNTNRGSLPLSDELFNRLRSR